MLESLLWAGPTGLIFSLLFYKVLGMAAQLKDLHTWHSRTDSEGKFIWYETNQVKDLAQVLHEHVAREEMQLKAVQARVDTIYERQSELVAHKAQLEQLHSKLATLCMNVQSLEGYIKHKCEGQSFNHSD